MPQQNYQIDAVLPHNRPSHLYTYWVSGKGDFPYDMLRYDQAWPLEHINDIPKREHRSVRIRSWKPPTEARWASFWWFVSYNDPIAIQELHRAAAAKVGETDVILRGGKK